MKKLSNGYELGEGTLVYYTGDQANLPDFGIVEAVEPPDRFSGWTLRVKLEDGRVFRGVSLMNFEGRGRRFMTAEEHHDIRREKIAKIQQWAKSQKSGK